MPERDKTPLISVVITSYNYAHYIGKAIESVLHQSFDDLELIILDNCSEDNTEEVVTPFLEDARCTLIRHETNIGATANFEKAIETGTGKYLLILSADDFLLPGHIEKLVGLLEENPQCILAYTPCYWGNENNEIVQLASHLGHKKASYSGGRSEMADMLVFDCYITLCAVVFRRSELEQSGFRFDTGYEGAMDWDMYVRLAEYNSDFVFEQNATAIYRIHEKQYSQKSFYATLQPLTDHIRLLEKVLENGEVDESICTRRNEIMQHLLRRYEVYRENPEAKKYEPRIIALQEKLDTLRPEFQALEDTPLVSVIMPTLNRKSMILNALESLKEQTYENWEVIVVNDGGEDNPAIEAFDSRVRYYRFSENYGQSAARNTALRLAQGDIVCYLDDDDRFLSNHLETIVKAMQKSNGAFVYTISQHVEQLEDGDGFRYGEPVTPYADIKYSSERLRIQNYIPINTWAHRRECLKKTGLFDETLTSLEDWELLIRFSQYFDIEKIDEVTVEVRYRNEDNENVSSRGRKDFYDIYKKVYDRYDNLGHAMVEQERQRVLQGFLHEKKMLENPAKLIAYLNHPFARSGGEHREEAMLRAFGYLDEYRLESAWHIEGDRYSLDIGVLDAAETVLVHNRGALFNEAVQKLQEQGKQVIYMMDESFLDLPVKHESYRYYQALAPRIRFMLDSADRVIVPSQYLATRCTTENTVVTIEPGVDTNLWMKPVERHSEAGKVVIAFFGDEQDFEALTFIKPTLTEIQKRYGDRVELKIFGLNVSTHKLMPFKEFNAANLKIPKYTEWITYLRAQQIDIALVPRKKDHYSLSLSTGRTLDFALTSIPVVCSDVTPFAKMIDHGVNGMLCGDDMQSWLQAIDTLVTSEQVRTDMANSAFTEALTKRTAQHSAKVWLDLLNDMELKSNLHEGEIITSSAWEWNKYDILAMERYPAWLENCRFKQSDITVWAKEAEHWTILPRFALYLHLDETNHEGLSRSIDSLSNQLYPEWKLVVISAFEAPSELFATHPQLEWVQSGEGLAQTLNQHVNANDVEWLAVAESGDLFEPQMLAAFAQTLQARPQLEMIYCDHGGISAEGVLGNPVFKPDLNIDMLRSSDYIGGTFVCTKTLFTQAGGLDGSLPLVELYDFALKVTEYTEAEKIAHIDELLWHKAVSTEKSDEAKSVENAAARIALSRHLQRSGDDAQVVEGICEGTYRVLYSHADSPLVTIIIPTKNNYAYLNRCIGTIFEKTSYEHYEIIIVDNASDEEALLSYLQQLQEEKPAQVRVIQYNKPFNYSEANNEAAKVANGEYLLFLNNDTEVLHDNWLDVMMSHAQRKEVGVVGPRLINHEGVIQHAGVVLGMTGPAGHIYGNESPDISGYMNRQQIDQNYSAVTGAAMLMRRSVFEAVEGFNATDYTMHYSDIDLCLKVIESGHFVVWTPYTTLLHYESVSVKSGTQGELTAKQERFVKDQQAFVDRWFDWLCHDPAYNRNLDSGTMESVIDIHDLPGWNRLCSRTPRIWAIPRGLDGGGEYRVISPLKGLSEAGLIQGHIGWHYYGHVFLMMRHNPDVILMQTPLHDHQLTFLETMKKHFKGKLIFEIDDLLTDIPKDNPAYVRRYPDIDKRMDKALSLCDRMVVSTQPLKDAYGHHVDDVQVVPNCLSEKVWGDLKSQRNAGKKPRIGWAGSPFHAGDLRIIKEVVKQFKDEVEWVFMGMYPEDCKDDIHEFHPSVSLEEYPQKLATLNLDLALVPLELNSFNEAKSNLRLLEMGILGWPVICSDAYPYRGAPVKIVENRTKAWTKAVREKLNDMDAAAKEGDALRQWVIDNFILETNLEKIATSYI